MTKTEHFKTFKTKIEARFPGARVSDEGTVFTIDAPPGHTWDGDLHCFVAPYRDRLDDLRDRRMIADAITDAMGRLSWVTSPVKCAADCDYCYPEEGA